MWPVLVLSKKKILFMENTQEKAQQLIYVGSKTGNEGIGGAAMAFGSI